jgi:hypothetical protein
MREFYTFSEESDRALRNAVKEIERRFDEAVIDRHLPRTRSLIERIAQDVLAPVFTEYREHGVTDTEPRCALGDALDEIMASHGKPQPSWQAYDLYGRR